ncbi:hypothetical protein OG895_18720 [Streptomyces sp. NBC_00201]|nr:MULTISPECIES: hypothetical protein [unclassified Streptomyces]MCX5049281.1 hypothetical protein [Streptomyces sp. NBC_00474]MCX5055968.1 hypothetical protein [Streptomyces sp. NBC_00452]MCX5247220.1 hypothetical protein [Streptomyces sp. NBC_00201]MCX5287019.1 hypothetical protein [Streptomyces sp. NBC_00183]
MRASSTVTRSGGSGSRSMIVRAVSWARRSVDMCTSSIRTPPAARAATRSAAWSAWRRPSAVSGASSRPAKRFCSLAWDSP